tara:strand:- start:220 stop:1224 length:1005 start_codon:yes stop_codon:yes gene_type:complete
MILYYGIGMHVAGGLTVLKKLVENINTENSLIYYDSRVGSFIENIKNSHPKKYNLFIRIWDEYKIAKNDKFKKIFYLNGLPPIFKNKNTQSIVLFQNTNIFKTKYRNFFSWFFSRDFLRFIKFFLFKSKVNDWVVLSLNAKRILQKYLPKSSNIILVNLDDHKNKNKTNYDKKTYDFIYPATLGYHKNHDKLIESFCLLAEEDIYPSLLLTISEQELKKTNFLNIVQTNSLNIYFKYFEPDEMAKIYSDTRALIYPSMNETLGLPLIEAKTYNLDIIASELDFVRDLSDPIQSFDPTSALSISRAVKRYLLINNIDSDYFIDYGLFLNYLKTDK